MSFRFVTHFSASLVLAVAASGCGSSSPETPDFHYGLAEMESTVAGDWQGTLRMTGSPDTALTLHLQHAAPGTQTACANRVLAHTQCIDVSSLRLEGTLTTADKTFEAAPLTGSFDVMGLELSEGRLSLSTKTGIALYVTYSQGGFGTGQVQKSGGVAAGTFDLERP